MGNSTAKTRKGKGNRPKVDLERLSEIFPSPENDQLYRPPDRADPEIIALAESIRRHGILEPLIITADGYIVSGHRRHVAAGLAGLTSVPVRRLRIRRSTDPNKFLKLLREHNRQRDKTATEKLREELVSIDPENARESLLQYRRAAAAVPVPALTMSGYCGRKAISSAKFPMLNAVKAIIRERQRFWPLTDRQIHYALQNDPPLIHASKPDSVYRNDVPSYRALIDLLTRARLDGSIAFEAIGDETRPVEVWATHQDTRPFIRRELDGMLKGYWRDLMQSQPNHIEIVAEKNTVAPIVKPVAADYTITMTTGRGFCSLPPRHALAERFERSGRDKLVLLFVADFDPEGESIPESFARSMRDDFGIDAIHAIKLALTAQQVAEFDLPPMMQAKATSSRYKKFADRHGDDVFELEALPPDELQRLIRESIESVIDRDAYREEIAAEAHDAAFLEGVRRTVHDALGKLDLGNT